MGPGLLAPITCILATAEVELTAIGDRWSEQTTLQVITDARCPYVDLLLPDDATLEDLDVRLRRGDGGRRRLRPELLEAVVGATEAGDRLRIHTPSLLPGDTLEIEARRDLPGRPYRFDPSAQRARFAQIRWVAGEQTGDRWFERAAADDALIVAHPMDADVNGPTPRLPDPPAEATLTQTLQVPGEPLRSLYPGGGSSLATVWTIQTPPQPAPASIVVPIPGRADEVLIEGEHLRRAHSVVLQIPAGERATSHTLRWTQPDAPTHGLHARLDGAEVQHVVLAPGGRVRWEDRHSWRLSAYGARPLTPDPARLVRSLDSRFRRAALPEPAIPSDLRGIERGVPLIVGLRDALWSRAGVAPLALDPLFPRRLVKARRRGALTSLEAALTLAMQLGQVRLPATWALIHVGPSAQAPLASPAGYTVGLVALVEPDGLRFVDPGCPLCGPYEVRPHLQGAAALSPAGPTGPPVVDGLLAVDDAADGKRTLRFEGPAALLLREALAARPPAERSAWLARTFGGADASLSALEGVGTRGGPITASIDGASATRDPRAALGAGWAGERRWTRPAQAADAPTHEHPADGVCARARIQADRWSHQVWVADPHRDPAAVEAATQPPSDHPVDVHQRGALPSDGELHPVSPAE